MRSLISLPLFVLAAAVYPSIAHSVVGVANILANPASLADSESLPGLELGPHPRFIARSSLKDECVIDAVSGVLKETGSKIQDFLVQLPALESFTKELKEVYAKHSSHLIADVKEVLDIQTVDEGGSIITQTKQKIMQRVSVVRTIARDGNSLVSALVKTVLKVGNGHAELLKLVKDIFAPLPRNLLTKVSSCYKP